MTAGGPTADAGSVQTTNNSAVAGYRASAPDSSTSGVGAPSGVASGSGVSNLYNSVGAGASTAAGVYGIEQGLRAGGVSGNAQAALGTAELANRGGAFGANSTNVGYGLGTAGGVLGIYNGVKTGGIPGYGGAAVGALRAGSGIAGLAGDSALSGTLGTAAGIVAAPLALYNAVKGWKSGATGSDALNGLEAGATIGSLAGPLGTAAGALIGGAVGAASSIFGPGKEDAENVGWNQYAQAYDKGGAASVSGASPSQNFQALAGIFDSRGSSIPFYGKYGRQGENQFTTDMMKQVNSAISSGKVAPGATPAQIYAKVVAPWINSMSPGGWQNSYTIQGASEKGAVGNVLTSLIGQWQNGQINSNTQLGIGGQTLQGGVPTYGA